MKNVRSAALSTFILQWRGTKTLRPASKMCFRITGRTWMYHLDSNYVRADSLFRLTLKIWRFTLQRECTGWFSTVRRDVRRLRSWDVYALYFFALTIKSNMKHHTITRLTWREWHWWVFRKYRPLFTKILLSQDWSLHLQKLLEKDLGQKKLPWNSPR